MMMMVMVMMMMMVMMMIRKLNLTELQEPFTMWKHNSKGLNSIGDYDYYVYEEEWRNPRNFKLDGEKTILFSLFSSFDSGFKAYYYCMEQLLEYGH